MILKEELKKFSLFSNFTDEELKNILSMVEEKKFEDGEVIIDEKATSTNLYLILSGRVKIYKKLPGSINFLTILDQYDIFGEVSFLDHMARSASASAVGETKLGLLSFEAFEKFRAEYPAVATKFIFALSKELTRKFRAVSEGLDVKSTEYTIYELIVSGRQVKVSTAQGTDYICTIKYADRSNNFPLLKIDVKGQIILIPFHQVKAIILPNKFGRF